MVEIGEKSFDFGLFMCQKLWKAKKLYLKCRRSMIIIKHVQIILSLLVHIRGTPEERKNMDYTTFTNIMQNNMKEYLSPDVTVDVHSTLKNNGTIRTGLMFIQPDVNTFPTIYLEEFYDQYLQGESMNTLVQSMQEIYEKVKVKQSFPYNRILEYPKMKERIVYKVIQRKSNEELLTQVPHELYLDLAIVYYALMETTEYGTATLLIRNEHLKGWNITKEDLREAARKNTPCLLPAEGYVLADYMYLVTNCMKSFGAAVMLYDGFWERMETMIGENFFVIPSSVHELILIPESFGMDRRHLQEMVREVNRTEVEKEEVLSDNVYYYSKEEGRLLY